MKKSISIIPLILLFASCSSKPNKIQNHTSNNQTPDTNFNESIESFSFDTIYLGKERLGDSIWATTIIQPKNLNKIVVHGCDTTTEFFDHYIGELDIKNKKYHVISRFRTIQLAISKRGRSTIFFLDNNKNVAQSYTWDLIPQDLPTKIRDNQLIFYKENMVRKYEIQDSFPPFLCVEEIKGYENIGCFEAD